MPKASQVINATNNMLMLTWSVEDRNVYRLNDTEQKFAKFNDPIMFQPPEHHFHYYFHDAFDSPIEPNYTQFRSKV